jgi:hypothetical protein
MICTVEVPAGVTGALGVVGALGAVDWAEELPPPHPFSSHAPASKLSKMVRCRADEENFRLLSPSAIVSNPGAQNAAAGSTGLLFGDGGGVAGSTFAVLPAV